MGIDVYLTWEGQTEEERQAQYTGFSAQHGHLREAYHGGPYATKVLVPEGWGGSQPEGGVEIPSATLRKRLPQTIKTCRKRNLAIYKNKNPAAVKAFEDFVTLAERKEAETGKPCKILVSY